MNTQFVYSVRAGGMAQRSRGAVSQAGGDNFFCAPDRAGGLGGVIPPGRLDAEIREAPFGSCSPDDDMNEATFRGVPCCSASRSASSS
jgi:hypothetical protein